MHPVVCLCVLLTTCLTPAIGDLGNAQSIYLTYNRLYNDILSRPAFVHKLPPCLENCSKLENPIYFNLLILDVQEIDELSQVMTLDVYFEIFWYYGESAWSPSEYDGIQGIELDSESVWTPDIFIAMGKKNSFNLKPEGNAFFHHEGYGKYLKHQYLSFMCDIDFDHYPFDTQTCSVGFYHVQIPYYPMVIQELNFNISTIYNRSGEWIMEKISHAFYDGNKDNFPEGIQYYIFTVRRQSTYYVVTIIFPMVLTSVMIPLVFLIPAQTGEKISYLVAIFTSTAIFLHYILNVMPRSLSRMPYLAILLIEVLVEGFLTMLASLLVVNISKKEANDHNCNENCGEKATLPPYDDQKIQQSTDDQTNCCKGPDIINHDATQGHVRKIPPRYLDTMFFTIFMAGQILFLVMLFVGTEWVQGKSESETGNMLFSEG